MPSTVFKLKALILFRPWVARPGSVITGRYFKRGEKIIRFS
jgi:hypothetical protein